MEVCLCCCVSLCVCVSVCLCCLVSDTCDRTHTHSAFPLAPHAQFWFVFHLPYCVCCACFIAATGVIVGSTARQRYSARLDRDEVKGRTDVLLPHEDGRDAVEQAGVEYCRIQGGINTDSDYTPHRTVGSCDGGDRQREKRGDSTATMLRAVLALVAAAVVSAAVPLSQVEALEELFSSTDGPGWRCNDHWGVGDPCDNSWCRVGCSDSGAVTCVRRPRCSRLIAAAAEQVPAVRCGASAGAWACWTTC